MNPTFNTIAFQKRNDKGKAKAHVVDNDFASVYAIDSEEDDMQRAIAESWAQAQDYHINKSSGSSTGPGTLSRLENESQSTNYTGRPNAKLGDVDETSDEHGSGESVTPGECSSDSDDDDLDEVITNVSLQQQTAALRLHTQRPASLNLLKLPSYDSVLDNVNSKMSSLEAGDPRPDEYNYIKDDRSSRRSTRSLKRRAPDAEDEQNIPANADGPRPKARYNPRRRLDPLETAAHVQESESVEKAPSNADEAEKAHEKLEEKQAQSNSALAQTEMFAAPDSTIAQTEIPGQTPVELASELATIPPPARGEEVPQETPAAHAQQEAIRDEPLQATQQSPLEPSPAVACGSTPEIPAQQELSWQPTQRSFLKPSPAVAFRSTPEIPERHELPLPAPPKCEEPAYLATESSEQALRVDLKSSQVLYAPSQNHYMRNDVQARQPLPAETYQPYQHFYTGPLVSAAEDVQMDVMEAKEKMAVEALLDLQEDHQMSNVDLQEPYQTPAVEEYDPRQPYFHAPLVSAGQSIKVVMETQEATAEVPTGAMEEIEEEMGQAEEMEVVPTFTRIHLVNEDEEMPAMLVVSADNYDAASSMWTNMGAAVVGRLSSFAEWNRQLVQSLYGRVLQSGPEDVEMGTSLDDMVEELINKFEQLNVVPDNEQVLVLRDRRRRHRYAAEPYQCLDTIARREAKRKVEAKKLNICRRHSARTQKSSATAAVASSLPVIDSPDAPIHTPECAPVSKTVLDAPVANSDDAPSTAASPHVSSSEATALTTIPVPSSAHRTFPTHAAPAAHICSFLSISHSQSNAPIPSALPAPTVNNGNQMPSTAAAATTSSLPSALPNSAQASNSLSTLVPTPVTSSQAPAAPASTAVDARTSSVSTTGGMRLDEYDDARVMPGHYTLEHGYLDEEESWEYPIGLLSFTAVVLTAAAYVR